MRPSTSANSARVSKLRNQEYSQENALQQKQ